MLPGEGSDTLGHPRHGRSVCRKVFQLVEIQSVGSTEEPVRRIGRQRIFAHSRQVRRPEDNPHSRKVDFLISGTSDTAEVDAPAVAALDVATKPADRLNEAVSDAAVRILRGFGEVTELG